MDIKDYFIKKKSEIQIAKEKITDDIMKQNGMYDMYFLGEIGTIETIVNYVDKEICIALLTGLIESNEASETIKQLSKDLIEKYSKEPKFEL